MQLLSIVFVTLTAKLRGKASCYDQGKPADPRLTYGIIIIEIQCFPYLFKVTEFMPTSMKNTIVHVCAMLTNLCCVVCVCVCVCVTACN
jgi:hypothetical protein